MSLLPWWLKALIAAALVTLAVLAWHRFLEHQRGIGRAEVRAEWDAAIQTDNEANARETLRRLTRQQENQRVQNEELAAARRDAGRNADAAEQLREQNASLARQWRDALRDSPSVADREAAADAIGVLADVLGRADRRAGVLAAYADAARAAGLKCERDYDALSVTP